ncbi:MAG TPA: NAD(P)H-hydrate dehydratase, partial [Polyangiaceae bacterium]|nr:NAD(P)H-hydrate dehydratase [Polyangiaceae bacterium]
GGEVVAWAAGSTLGGLGQAIASADVVVDALFGTGLDRPLDDFFAEAVRIVNAAPGRRFAVDLPSGLDADTGAALGAAVEARVTATFAHPKLGLLTPNGAKVAGKVRVVDIGVPGPLSPFDRASALLLDDADVAAWLARRAPGAHKTNGGHVAILGGSPGKVGAPKLVARGAMRAGAGLATIVTWPEAAATIEASVLEVMTARIDPARPASLDEALRGKHVLAMGPGLGLSDAARAWVTHALAEWAGPVVVDADALTLFAGHPEALRATKRGVLTPHPGEAARLLGRSPAQVEADRFAAARELSAAAGAVVVLKGAHSIVASPDGTLAVSPVACAALATAGSGDVLTGVVAALAHALAPFEAACAGVLLHGRAGEAWSRAHGGADRGMLASEIADHLPSLLGAL